MMPKKCPKGLKLAGDPLIDTQGVHTPFTVSATVLPYPGPSKRGLPERIRAHWVGKDGRLKNATPM